MIVKKELDLNNLVQKIKRLCNEKGYDYATLSKKSGVPLSTIMNIVNGNTSNPGIFTITKLCNGFEITIAEFFE